MTDGKQQGEASVEEAVEDAAEDFAAPERGSAEELLDAEAGDPLDPMRHSAAHVMAEAVLDLFPGTKLGIGPAIQDGFYYDFQLDRPLKPDDLAAIEARMAEIVAADSPFVRRELPPEEGRAFFAERGQPFKVEILDDLAAKAKAEGAADAAGVGLRARRLRRPLQGSARREHRQARAVQAPRGRRRVLARRREAPDAPAHLRHGLADPGGARPIPVAPPGGEEARPPPARRPARPVQLPRRVAGVRLLAPQGPDDLANARGGDARAPARRGYQEVSHPDPRRQEALAAVRATGTSTT